MKIELRASDLEVKTLDDGREVVNIKPFLAFDEAFIQECVSSGVKPYTIRENEEEELDEEE
jgi:hypothetical protein